MAETKKKAGTTTTKKATTKAEPKPAKVEEKVADTRDDEIKLLKEQIALLKQQIEAKPQIVTVGPETEKVMFLWQAEVADDNVLMIGPSGMYGRITGKTGSFFVPKTELSRILDENVRSMLKRRWLIITSGITDDEREALDCDYKEGEILDKKAFAKMVEIGDEMLEIYPKLCKGHRDMVARRYAEAFENGSPYITRERVVALNNASKEIDGGKGAFIGIIETMNERDAQ